MANLAIFMDESLRFLRPIFSLQWGVRYGKSPALRGRSRSDTNSGLGQSLGQVIVGRLIAGVGGAGINCLVSIVIAGMCKITCILISFC